jgi:hypothetical protein
LNFFCAGGIFFSLEVTIEMLQKLPMRINYKLMRSHCASITFHPSVVFASPVETPYNGLYTLMLNQTVTQPTWSQQECCGRSGEQHADLQ